jgi:hypothetical protein
MTGRCSANQLNADTASAGTSSIADRLARGPASPHSSAIEPTSAA